VRTIVFANQKGGVGKTTLSGHIGVQASSAGERVVLMDTDPQGSLSAWWNSRQAEDLAFAAAKLDELPQQLQALEAQGFTLIVVDTPPAITTTIAAVIQAADLVVIPTRASPHDLRAVGATVDLCGQRRPVFVINGAAPRAKLTTQAVIALSEYGAVAPSVVFQRTNYAGAMIDGRTMQEVDPKSRGAAEMEELWKYLLKQLARAQ
jgi:chromosome partitioning protein